jgi:hypothetical protein
VKYTQAHGHRTKILRLARALARSGDHGDHRSIVAELDDGDTAAEAHRWLTDRVITSQLDRLCAMAQTPEPANARSLAALLADARAAKSSATLR